MWKRFNLLSAGLLVMVAVQAWKGGWVGDFWEHAAVVRALAAHPLHPHHPLFAVAAAHAFYSPYALLLGLFCRVSTLSPLLVLPLAGLCNVVLLVLSLRALVGRLFGERAAFWALLFVLFLWGRDAWIWSGFLHFSALGLVAPYPSTFAAGLTLAALALYLRAQDENRRILYVPLGLLVAVVMLTHPTTAVALLAGLFGCFFARLRTRFWTHAPLFVATLVGAALLSLAWPYYPLRELFFSQAAEFNDASRALYENVVPQLGPCLLGLLPLFTRANKRGRDLLVPWLFLLALLYAAGYVLDIYGLGRLIGWIAVGLQLSLAEAIARLEETVSARSGRLLLAGLLVASLAWLPRATLLRCVPAARLPPPPWASALRQRLSEDDVVLADFGTHLFLPAHGGRVVAWMHPVYWVPDHDRRRGDIDRFFRAGTFLETRREIARRYAARFIVVGPGAGLPAAELDALAALGQVVFEREGTLLVELPRLLH